MTDRIPIGARRRFEIFKRDGFTCLYCGAHPPDAILEVDHIIAVAEGGTNDDDNLATACFPCNRGKSANSLQKIPQSLAERADGLAEREAQLAGYAAILAARRERIEIDVWAVIWELWREENCSRLRFNSIFNFVEKLGLEICLEAVRITLGKRIYTKEKQFRYFCGICWNKIRGQGG